MAIVLNGTTQYASCTSAVVSAYPYTLFAWFNSSDATTAAQGIWNLYQNADNSQRMQIRAAPDQAGTPVRGFAADAGSQGINTTTDYTASSWFRASMVCASSTSRIVYLNNAGSTTGTTNITPASMDRTLFGALTLGGVVSSWFNGSLAHAAIWDIALSATDLAQLEAGLSPMFVQRANLKTYLPLYDSTADLTGNYTFTAQGSPTYGADPGVRVPGGFGSLGAY